MMTLDGLHKTAQSVRKAAQFGTKPKRLTALALTSLIAVGAAFPAHAQTEIPIQTKVGDTAFQLVGCGKRAILWQDMYILSLYSGPGTTRMLTMKVVYDGKMPGHMPDDWIPHLQKVISSSAIDEINGVFAQIQTGDDVQFAYFADTQKSALLINGVPKYQTGGGALFSTVQSMWLGDEPISQPLKNKILNGTCAI